MNEILKSLSQEEIESLAIKQLESPMFEDEASLKIIKVDKEYKKHNKKAVAKAIMNASIILIFAGIVISSDSNISSFGTKELSEVFDNVLNTVSFLPQSDIIVAVYTTMFEGINKTIDTIGLMGLIIAVKSVNFVLSTFKDTKQSLKIKKELTELKEKLEAKEITSGHSI